MPDGQTQLAPTTVDAFLGAPEAKQHAALGQMTIPAKQALLGALKQRKAAGTLKTGGTEQPMTSPAPSTAAPSPSPASAPSNSLVSPGEGIYQMHDKSGKATPVSYSRVEAARGQGLRFADQKTLDQYSRDFTNDPAQKGSIQTFQENHPVLGFIPRVFEGIGGSLEEGLAGADRLLSKVDPVRRAMGVGPSEPLQLEAAKSANNPSAGLPEFLGATIEQIAELLVGEGEARAALKGTDLVGHLASKAPQTAARLKELTAVLAKYPKVKALMGMGLKVAAEGTKAAGEQGTQELVRSGGDVEATKQVAKQAGVVGAVIPLAGGLLAKGGELLGKSLQQRFDIDPFSIGKRLKKLDDETVLVHAENIKNLKQARTAGDDATVARLEHDNVVLGQKAIASKQQILSDGLEQARQVVYQRLQNMKSAARSYFGQAYGDIEKAGGGKGVELETLINDAEGAREHVKGSDDSLKVFNDLEKRYNHPDADLSKPPNSDISKEEWTTFSKEDKAIAWKDALKEEGGEGSTISLENLNGYYSELGRVAVSKSTPGDLKAAAKAMQKAIDNRIQETYGEELFKRNQLVRSQYREFAGQFLDADSPVAKAVDAPDYYHGTQTTFLTDDARQPAVRSRVKTMMIGDAKDPSTQFLGKDIAESYTRDPETGRMIASGETTPSWRYRRQTHSLIEHMRNLEEGLGKTTKAAEKAGTAAGASAENLAATRTAVRNLTPVKKTALPSMTPAELRQYKIETLTNLTHNLGKFGTWVAIGGLVGGAAGLFHGITTGKGAEGAVEEAGGGVVMGLIAPHLVSKMLVQPGVVESLTRLSRSDLEKLMKLPPSQRGPTEKLIKMLADEAVQSGKLKATQIPWLRVLAGTATRKMSDASRQGGQDVTTAADDLEKLNNELGEPTDQLGQPGQPEPAPQGVQP